MLIWTFSPVLVYETHAPRLSTPFSYTLYIGINEFKKGYQPRTNSVKDENGALLADSHHILNMWKNYFSQLLNVCRVSDVRQKEIHTTEPSVPQSSPFEFKVLLQR
jgi:hypothetical protein